MSYETGRAALQVRPSTVNAAAPRQRARVNGSSAAIVDRLSRVGGQPSGSRRLIVSRPLLVAGIQVKESAGHPVDAREHEDPKPGHAVDGDRFAEDHQVLIVLDRRGPIEERSCRPAGNRMCREIHQRHRPRPGGNVGDPGRITACGSGGDPRREVDPGAARHRCPRWSEDARAEQGGSDEQHDGSRRYANQTTRPTHVPHATDPRLCASARHAPAGRSGRAIRSPATGCSRDPGVPGSGAAPPGRGSG